MSGTEHDSTLRRFEDRLTQLATSHYALLLFVTGASDLSVQAIRNVRNLCETYLQGRYELEVIDIYRDPTLMSTYGVVAAPTLVRQQPKPVRMLVGDLSDTTRVLAGLDIRQTARVPKLPAVT
jgi:circadian clock protein KaiB